MNLKANKKLVGVGFVLLALVVSGAILLISSKKAGPLVSPAVQEEEKEPELLTWEDQAGFSFLYPEGVEIDSHEEDTENFAHLELTNPVHPGRIIIWVKETGYKDIEAWAEEEVDKEAQVFDTQLAEEPAKKVASSNPEKLVVAAIDVDALVLLELEPDLSADKAGEGDYWQGIFDQILDNFAFIPVEGEEVAAPAGGEEAPAGGGGVIWEAEEVIE